MDFYLSPAGKEYLPEIQLLARQEPSQQTDALLLGYAMEATRIAGGLGTYREAAASAVINEDYGQSLPVRQGDRVFVKLVRLLQRLSPTLVTMHMN